MDYKLEEIERDGVVQYCFTCSNGYEEDLWNLAILKDGDLHYDNPL